MNPRDPEVPCLGGGSLFHQGYRRGGDGCTRAADEATG
jgi:hypothetical protein